MIYLLFQLTYPLSRVQLNFLHLNNADAVQRVTILSLHPHHPAHTKWKGGHAPPPLTSTTTSLRFRGQRGEVVTMATNGEGRPRLQCRANSTQQHSRRHQECSVHFELSTTQLPVSIQQLPVADVLVPSELCEQLPCQVEVGPVCFTTDSHFSGG